MSKRQPRTIGARTQHKAVRTTRVNELRIAAGLTQRQLATRAGVGLRTVARMMAGTHCKPRACALVAHELGADPLVLWPHLASHPDVLLYVPRNVVRQEV